MLAKVSEFFEQRSRFFCSEFRAQHTTKVFAWGVLAGPISYQGSLFLLTMRVGHLEAAGTLPYRTRILSRVGVTELFELRGLTALGRSILSTGANRGR